MEARDTITAALLSAFLKCPTKARFLSLGERPPDSYFSDIEEAIASMYKSRACGMLHDRGELSELTAFGQLAKKGSAPQWFDCEKAVCNVKSLRRASADTRSRKPATVSLVVPVHFSPWEKPELSDSLLVCFGALSFSVATETHAETGTLIYGDGLRRKTVWISDYASRLDRIIRDICSVLPSSGETPLVLNAHCAACDFRSKCRGVRGTGIQWQQFGGELVGISECPVPEAEFWPMDWPGQQYAGYLPFRHSGRFNTDDGKLSFL